MSASVEIKEKAAAPEASEQTGLSIRLESKHLLAIRWMHWVNFPVLLTMVWSGLMIY